MGDFVNKKKTAKKKTANVKIKDNVLYTKERKYIEIKTRNWILTGTAIAMGIIFTIMIFAGVNLAWEKNFIGIALLIGGGYLFRWLQIACKETSFHEIKKQYLHTEKVGGEDIGEAAGTDVLHFE